MTNLDEYLLNQGKRKPLNYDKKLSSKNFYQESKQRLGSFEMVFKNHDKLAVP